MLDREDVRARLGNNRHLLKRIVSLFLGERPRLLSTVRQASLGGDTAELARAAHTLRGALANPGAATACRAAMMAEEAGRRGDLAEATVSVSTLEEETNLVRDALLEWKQQDYA